MSRIVLIFLLLLSTGFNLAAVSGYVYFRHIGHSSWGLEELRSRLQLSSMDEQHLLDLRNNLLKLVKENQAKQADLPKKLATYLATRHADDAQLQQTINQVVNARSNIHRQAITLIIGFRDKLSPTARQKFNEQLQTPRFLAHLLGVNQSNENTVQ